MRNPLLFACHRLDVEVPETAGAVRVVGDGYGVRFVPAQDALGAPWPDTMLVSPFDDAADEEIALERGEIDVAVFWPGELSSHLRDHPRWKARLSSVRARGLVLAAWPEMESPASACALAVRETPRLEAMNRSLFRGDLRVLRNAPAECGDVPGEAVPARVRYEVDSRTPGRPLLERFLNRGPWGEAELDRAPVVRLFYLDAPYPVRAETLDLAADHLRREPFPAALRARAERLRSSAPERDPAAPGDDTGALERTAWDSLRVAPALAIECPVLCDPRLLPYARALGPQVFVNLFACSDGESRR